MRLMITDDVPHVALPVVGAFVCILAALDEQVSHIPGQAAAQAGISRLWPATGLCLMPTTSQPNPPRTSSAPAQSAHAKCRPRPSAHRE